VGEFATVYADDSFTHRSIPSRQGRGSQ